MKFLSLKVGDREVSAWVEKINGTLWIHKDGVTSSYKPAAKNYGGAAAGAGQDGVLAPMPGKVVKCLCEKGDTVTKGQVLVALEAMKMEYALKADRDGVVENVNCAPGQQVELGAVLVSLEAVDGQD